MAAVTATQNTIMLPKKISATHSIRSILSSISIRKGPIGRHGCELPRLSPLSRFTANNEILPHGKPKVKKYLLNGKLFGKKIILPQAAWR
jgi:hypothetical protein